MITELITGGIRDYVQLTAETLDECNNLCLVATSEFIEDDRVFLDLSKQVIIDRVYHETVSIKIWVSAERPKQGLDQLEREELDQSL